MRGTLIFDGDCGFCTRSRNFLAKIDTEARVTLIALQQQQAVQISGRSRAELSDSVYWIGADGSTSRGAEAINAALGAALDLRLPGQVYRRVPGMRITQEWIYRKIAANRHRLPGATPWCQQHPEDCQGAAQ